MRGASSRDCRSARGGKPDYRSEPRDSWRLPMLFPVSRSHTLINSRRLVSASGRIPSFPACFASSRGFPWTASAFLDWPASVPWASKYRSPNRAFKLPAGRDRDRIQLDTSGLGSKRSVAFRSANASEFPERKAMGRADWKGMARYFSAELISWHVSPPPNAEQERNKPTAYGKLTCARPGGARSARGCSASGPRDRLSERLGMT